MNAFIISFVLLLLSISSFAVMMFIVNSGDYTKLKNKPDCENPNENKNIGDSCGAWDGSQCRIGVIKKSKDDSSKNVCVAKGSLVPLMLLILGCFFFIMSIIYLVVAIKAKGKK